MIKADKEGQRKAPILRFKGFTDDWEQRELGNLFNERKEKSTKGELLSVTLSNGVTKFSDLNKKDNSNIKSGNYKVVKKNDIPYNSMRMWQGASGVSSYDGIVSPAYTVLVPNRNSNSNFYAVLFKKKSILNLFTRFSQGLTSDTWNLKYPILKDIIVPFTNLEEQKRIFKIFNVINNLLALYERKIKLLSQVKKYFLDNLFTKKEYPNLRFKGFTDAWEQRKLNSIFETVSKKGFPNLPVLTATQTKGMIYRNNSGIDIKFNKNTLNNYKLVEPNQFVVHLRSFQGGLAASSLRGIASPAYTVLRFKDNKQSVNFWKEFFRSKKFINSLVKVTYGIRDGRTIKVTDLLDLKYQIPSQNLEQCKIGQLINSINKLLTLYETKHQHLTKIKKTLLNTMFI